MIAAANPLQTAFCLGTLAYLIVLFLYFVLSLALLMGFRPPVDGPVRSGIELIQDVTEPVLRPLRRWIPPVGAGGIGIDLSLTVLIIILLVVRTAVC